MVFHGFLVISSASFASFPPTGSLCSGRPHGTGIGPGVHRQGLVAWKHPWCFKEMHAYVYLYIYIYTNTHTHTHIYIYIYLSIYINIYIYLFVHMYIHTFACVCVKSALSSMKLQLLRVKLYIQHQNLQGTMLRLPTTVSGLADVLRFDQSTSSQRSFSQLSFSQFNSDLMGFYNIL